ncbi:MAG TPA: hypothetical protein VLX92_00400 [Kofleriaceae bacterium]|nr:hypothetical protein [Kofleriaceae bacterium]
MLATLLHAQTERLARATDITSRYTESAAPRVATPRASDGSPLHVRSNGAGSDLLVVGAAHAIRFTTRSRGWARTNLELGCMATIGDLGRAVFSAASASAVFAGVGVAWRDRLLSVTFELQPDGKIVVEGVQRGMKLGAPLRELLDPKHASAFPLTSWLGDVTGGELAELRYVEPLLAHVGAAYRVRLSRAVALANMNSGTLVNLVASLRHHHDKLRDAPEAATRTLVKGALACVATGLPLVLGGPLAPLLGCLAGFTGVIAQPIIEQAFAGSPSADDPRDDDGWGGVCCDGDAGGDAREPWLE